MEMSFYVGAIGAFNCTEKLSVVSNNLANFNNTGFKSKTAVFSDLINYNLNDSPDAVTELQAGAGMRVARTYTTFDVSGATQTGSQLDYAILQPNAFFMVQDPETDEITYTRDGHFHRADMGGNFYLMTDGGKYVLDENQQPIVLGENEEETEPGLYTFANPSRLLSVGNNEYVPSDEGVEAIAVEQPSLMKGALESSGTDMAEEFSRLIECQRAFSYALKMVQTSDEVTSTINSLRG
ncbi:MAG: flagellar hook-basal body complex protein [Lachnospiraceae bacterium]